MMTRVSISIAVSAALLFLWGPVCLAQPIEVTFFGNNQAQPTNIKAARQLGVSITVYNLDAPTNLEQQLADGLPAGDIEKATLIAQQRVAQIPQADMVSLFSGVLKAREWNIERFPAIVFGPGETVIYGLTDLEQAVLLWRDHPAAGGIAQ